MASPSRNNKILQELVQEPGNSVCADCAAPEPDWASYTLGVFVCLNCSGMHRNLHAVSKVKSNWEDSLVQFMRERGNTAAKDIFEKCVPSFFYRPHQKDCVVLKDQWIRSKYERREFTGESNFFLKTYSADLFEVVLWKKGKDNKQFLKRIFLLSQKDFTLRYFIKEDSKVPKAVISMKDLNAEFQPEKIGHAHGLQISFKEDEHTRNLFVYHEDGQLIPQIQAHCLKEGYMEKTGPTQREAFKKRWFTLFSTNRKLLYFKSPLDATDLGSVFIGSENHGYSVSESCGRNMRSGRWHCGITLETPGRQFVFMCEQEQERKEWMEAFRAIISQPMTPEDYSNEATLTRGK
nr:arf-GAP with dual PH domain-containing protein 2 isoform X2 [Nothobranchius furzeri]